MKRTIKIQVFVSIATIGVSVLVWKFAGHLGEAVITPCLAFIIFGVYGTVDAMGHWL